ncbi:hypothetical protein [Roseovarius sp.]|uniref:hypothetical protein n=1 Tax=Roseovarius sp. TaxID=1486281 RepID=UPI0026351FF4|nr:hypothetical protein [Roseovarius sp.]
MSNITKLPTAVTSYFTVQKAGSWFNVVLVTPCPGKNLKTTVAQFSDRESAMLAGKRAAARQMRPFKAKGGRT